MSREKRSITLHGHRTSIALETEFWAVIDGAIDQSGQSFAEFMRDLDDARVADGPTQNLASYIRVWALKSAQQRL